MTYQWKLLKNYSIMPIKCSFDPLFDRQQLKNTRKLHFRWLFYWESMSTPNVIASWVLVWTLVLRFIFKYCRGGVSHPTEIYLEIKYLVLWHIKLNPLRNSIHISQLSAHFTPHSTICSKIYSESRFFIIVHTAYSFCFYCWQLSIFSTWEKLGVDTWSLVRLISITYQELSFDMSHDPIFFCWFLGG